jgi:nucleoside permease NupC
VRFITFETLVTGVRAFECAFSVRTSSFVHGLMTRRAVFAFTVLADFVLLTVFFKALGIIQVLHLTVRQIGMRCGDERADSLMYSILKVTIGT